MKRRHGFTLIELMIVVAIIAIIASIAIPSLMQSQKSANETSAIGSLKNIFSAEAVWRQTSMSGTGRLDFWTYDASCMYRMLKGGNPSSYINVDVAKSDISWAADNTFGVNVIDPWTAITTTLSAKSGYNIQSLDDYQDANMGAPENYNSNISNGVPCANAYKFGFIAAPAVYGTSGNRSFIVNEKGVVYGADPGFEANKWRTTGTDVLRWLTDNPTDTVNWPPITGGKPWMGVSD